MNLFNPYNNINLWIKHTFLSFAQAYFSLDPKFTWNLDPKITKIIIADKFAIDLGVVDKRPSIILSRGPYGWSDVVRGQDGQNAVLSNKKIDTLAPAPSADRSVDFIFTDIVRGSVTYNVISKNGIEAEDIANRLFVGLSGYKKELQSYGIHKTMGLSIGDERIIRATSEIEAVGITVSLGFLAQRTVIKAGKLNNVEVTKTISRQTTTGFTPVVVDLYENIDYRILNNGTTIQFVNPPSLDVISLNVNFVNAIDLNVISGVLIGVIDGSNDTFIVPSGAIYGYYTLNSQIIVSGVSSVYGLSESEEPFYKIID